MPRFVKIFFIIFALGYRNTPGLLPRTQAISSGPSLPNVPSFLSIFLSWRKADQLLHETVQLLDRVFWRFPMHRAKNEEASDTGN